MDETSYLFNDVSDSHWSRLTNGDKKFVVQNRQDAFDAVKAHDADHAANKEQRIQDEEKRLMQHDKAEFNLQRPKGVPPPRLKTAKEITSEANSNIQNAYVHARQKIVLDARKRESQYIKTALNIQPREHSPEKDNDIQR